MTFPWRNFDQFQDTKHYVKEMPFGNDHNYKELHFIEEILFSFRGGKGSVAIVMRNTAVQGKRTWLGMKMQNERVAFSTPAPVKRRKKRKRKVMIENGHSIHDLFRSRKWMKILWKPTYLFSRRPYESWLVSARSRLYKGNNPRVVSVWKTTERNIAVGELRKPKFVFLENAWSRNSMHHIGIAGRFSGPLLIRRGWLQWLKNVCCCLLEIGEQIQCGHSLKNIFR